MQVEREQSLETAATRVLARRSTSSVSLACKAASRNSGSLDGEGSVVGKEQQGLTILAGCPFAGHDDESHGTSSSGQCENKKIAMLDRLGVETCPCSWFGDDAAEFFLGEWSSRTGHNFETVILRQEKGDLA